MNYSSEQLDSQSALAMRTHALLYYAASKYLTEAHGFAGGRAARRWIRMQGKWRGTEMRKAHTALGLPIDVEHVQRFWDNALSDFWYRKKGKYTTYDVAMQVPSCAYADVWQERDWWTWGHVYCDELHQSILSTYNPDAVVVIPECLMKGDDQCDFRWIMPPHAQIRFDGVPPPFEGQDYAEDYLADTPEIAAWKNLRRGVRLLAMELHTLHQVLAEMFPQDCEGDFEQIQTAFASERAKDLSRAMRTSDQPWQEFLKDHFDIPLTVFIPAYTEDGDVMTVELTDCPMLEGFSYFGSAPKYCGFCPRQFEGICAESEFPLQIKVSGRICNGDRTCRFIAGKKK